MVAALGTVARARGMSRAAKRTGPGRESLYKALSDSGNPVFTTIVGVASALGYTFEIKRQLSVDLPWQKKPAISSFA
jgi:probable addiction module antidote protein